MVGKKALHKINLGVIMKTVERSFKDFTIYRRFNGDWVAERNA